MISSSGLTTPLLIIRRLLISTTFSEVAAASPLPSCILGPRLHERRSTNSGDSAFTDSGSSETSGCDISTSVGKKVEAVEVMSGLQHGRGVCE
jgi:hypothetical protein